MGKPGQSGHRSGPAPVVIALWGLAVMALLWGMSVPGDEPVPDAGAATHLTYTTTVPDPVTPGQDPPVIPREETYPEGFGQVDPVPPPPDAFREDATLLAIAADEGLLAEFVDRDIAFRTSLGLQADRGYVEDLYRNPDKTIGRLGGGALLTPAEAEELDLRGRLEADAAAIEEALAESPGFGGVFIDNATGTLVVAVTDPILVSDLSVPLEHPERLEVRVVNWSLAELTAFKDAIFAQWQSGRLPDINSLGIRVSENRVVIGVAEDSPSGRLDPAEVVEEIAAEVGAPVGALRVMFSTIVNAPGLSDAGPGG